MDDQATQWVEKAKADAAVAHGHITGQLVALAKTKKWRKYRLLELTCQGCGDVLLQVMRTEPYPVMCFRQSARSAVDRDELRAMSDEERLRNVKPVRREREWHAWPIEWPLPEEEATRSHIDIFALCSCRHVLLSGPAIYEDLRQGVRKRVVPLRGAT